MGCPCPLSPLFASSLPLLLPPLLASCLYLLTCRYVFTSRPRPRPRPLLLPTEVEGRRRLLLLRKSCPFPQGPGHQGVGPDQSTLIVPSLARVGPHCLGCLCLLEPVSLDTFFSRMLLWFSCLMLSATSALRGLIITPVKEDLDA